MSASLVGSEMCIRDSLCSDGDGLDLSSQTGKVRIRKYDKRYQLVTDVLTLQHEVVNEAGEAGTPIPGHGAAIAFESMNSKKKNIPIGNVQFILENTTVDNEFTKIVFNARKAGITETPIATLTHRELTLPGNIDMAGSVFIDSSESEVIVHEGNSGDPTKGLSIYSSGGSVSVENVTVTNGDIIGVNLIDICLLYTSPSPRD